jgi:stringent starvation protein B
MISVHPYILRAIYQWICDTNLTPQLLVDTDNLEVVVPKEYIENDHIILNISPTAVRDLVLGDEYIMFNARFGGRFREISVPISCVQAIYARESNQGLSLAQFDMEQPHEAGDEPSKGNNVSVSDTDIQRKAKSKPILKIVK